MHFSKFGSFVLILLVAFATAETVQKAKDVSVETSESNTEIPGVTENVVQESPNATQEDLAETIALGGAELDKDGGENIKLEREALLEKRSIGNIARLLLGGNVPPNHPLVKNPEAKTFNLASNIVASVPGREFGASGWNSGGGWNSNTLSQISQLLSTKQKLIPHISQLTNGVTGIAGIKGDLFRQIQTISTAAIAQAAAEAAAKAVAASAAAQAVTNTIQHNNAVEDAKNNHNNLLQGWYSNNQNTYATLPTPIQTANTANSILTPYSQSSQVNNQFTQAPTQPGSYHSSYTQYQQQQQQQLLQQQQQQMNNLFTQQLQQNNNNNNNNNYNPVSNNYNSANNYNAPSNSYNPAAAPNFSSAPLVAAPSNLNQAQGSSVGSRNVPPSNNYNSQAGPAAFNSPGNSFGAAAHTNNAPQYSPAPTGNSFNNQQLPAAQNYGGYNNNGGSSFNRGPNNNFNNNYNRNAPVGGSGPGSGHVSGQYSHPAGSHVYPPNGQGGYSGPPPGNSNSASGVSGGYPNAQYHPSASSPGNQYSNNGQQNFQHPGPPYNSPSSDAYGGPPPASFNSPQGSYSNSNPNFGPQQQQQGAYGFSGNGNSNLNRNNNYDSAAPNNFNNYNNNYNRQNDNQFNGNQNRPSLYDSNNNNNYNRHPFDDNLNRNKNPNNFQGHSRFENSPIGTNAFHKGTRKGGGYYNNRNDEADNIEDSLEKREWSSPHKKVVVGGEKTTTYHTLTIREDHKNPVKAVYKELYNPHKHRWTEYPPRRGQIDDRPNFSAHPKSKFGPSRRAHHGHRGRPRHREPEQPREIYTTLPEYVFRNDRPNRSTNTSALLIPVDADYISTEDSVVNVSPLVEHVSDSSNLLVPSSVSDGVVVGSLPSTLTISLPSAEESSKIVPAITVFETSYVS